MSCVCVKYVHRKDTFIESGRARERENPWIVVRSGVLRPEVGHGGARIPSMGNSDSLRLFLTDKG